MRFLDVNPGRPSALSLAAPLVASILLIGACAAPGGPPAPAGTGAEPSLGAALATVPDPALFEDLGGHAGIDALTTAFIRELAADEVTRHRFRRSDIGRFKRMLEEQLCAESGGGCLYSGDDMRSVHAGMNISRAEFNAVVEALMRAMDVTGLDVGVQNRLLALHAPKRADIIEP